jgi:predicted amidohydrolase YtcJ
MIDEGTSVVIYHLKKYIFLFLIISVASIILLKTALAQATAPITIYTAKKIITMNAQQPEATAVAVKDNKIYAVGSLDGMKSWMKPGSFQVNDAFANSIITPGMIEAHSHFTMLAVFLQHTYVGYWNFPGKNGQILPGIKSKADVLTDLKQANQQLKDPAAVLFAWGYDPIYFNNEPLTATELDKISTTRPIFVLNASEHIAYINTYLLNKMGYNAKTKIPGVHKDAKGNPNGILEEAAATAPVLYSIYGQLFTPASFKETLYALANTAHQLGLTTVSELLFGFPNEKSLISELNTAAHDAAFPVRIIVIYNGMLLSAMEQKKTGSGIDHLKQLMQQNSNNLRFNGVKFVSDGSIQGFTARLNWPGYFNNAPNGLFNMTTDQLKQAALPFWKAGFPIHVHVNGNEATDSALDALNYLQIQAPRIAPLFVLEHNQLSSPAQFKRAHDLGAYTNLFANQIYYWGDQHYTMTLGPDRANDMDNAAEAKRQGIIFSLHTDSPVTPLGPLHSMWAAVNRLTASDRLLGENARISAEDALRAVTLNAAYLLNLQNEVGSIEIGKRADFTVLARDPLTENAFTLKDIPIVATIQDGHVYTINKG